MSESDSDSELKRKNLGLVTLHKFIIKESERRRECESDTSERKIQKD